MIEHKRKESGKVGDSGPAEDITEGLADSARQFSQTHLAHERMNPGEKKKWLD